MVDEFGAAWAQRRADGGDHAPRVASESFFEETDGFGEDLLDASAPAAVDVGRDPLLRVHEENRLAIGDLDHEADARKARNQGVPGRSRYERAPRISGFQDAFVHDLDLRSMDLRRRNQVIETQEPLDTEQIFIHVLGAVAVGPGCVLCVVRRKTHTAVAGEDPVGQTVECFEQAVGDGCEF